MSKLIAVKDFNRPVGKTLRLPYPEPLLAATVTVMLLRNGQIEVFGKIAPEEFSVKMLELGIERVRKHHASLKADQEASAQAEKPAGLDL